MKIINNLIIIIILLNLVVYSVQSSYSEPLFSSSHSTYKIVDNPTTIPVNLEMSTSNINQTILKSFSLGISSVVSPEYFYIVLDTQGLWNIHYGLGEIKLNFTLGDNNQIIELSSNGFIAGVAFFEPIILSYKNITVDPTNNLYINMSIDVTSYLNSQYNFTLYIKAIDLYFIENPLVNPIIIPSWQYGVIAMEGTNLFTNVNELDYTAFLPSNSDINITIIATAPIILKDIEIDHASWVNLPNLTLPNKNFTLNFVTDNAPSLYPRNLAIYYYATTSLPLKINISAEVVVFTIINPIPELNQNQTNIRFVIAIFLIFVPIGNLLKNRKKKLSNIKL